MSQTTFDSFEYAKNLENVGLTREQAEVHAKALSKIIDDKLVTREYLDFKLREIDRHLREMQYSLIIKLGSMIVGVSALIIAILK